MTGAPLDVGALVGLPETGAARQISRIVGDSAWLKRTDGKGPETGPYLVSELKPFDVSPPKGFYF